MIGGKTDKRKRDNRIGAAQHEKADESEIMPGDNVYKPILKTIGRSPKDEEHHPQQGKKTGRSCGSVSLLFSSLILLVDKKLLNRQSKIA